MKSCPRLLLVDDDDLEAVIMRRTLRELGIANELLFMSDGEEALGYLLEESCPLPCVILLDLNMPRMSGFEFLCHVKAEPALQHIPVFIVTTSTSETDKTKCLELGAKDYIVKTLDIHEFRRDLRCLRRHCEALDKTRDTSVVDAW